MNGDVILRLYWSTEFSDCISLSLCLTALIGYKLMIISMLEYGFADVVGLDR